MNYVGIDYHTKYALATRMKYDGTIISQDKIPTEREAIRGYLLQLPKHSQVVLEATVNWYSFAEWSHDLPIEVKLAHPQKTKAIASARIKTDSIDSKTLADLLRSNFIAESYLAPQDIRDTRELVRARTTLVRMSVKLQSRIRSVLHKTGERITARKIRSKKGRQELARLPLRSIYRDEIETCLRLLDVIGEEVVCYEAKIKNQAEVSKDTQLLMSIPGISFYSALLITSEIGDYTRFASSRKLCSWAGLVPSVYASGGKTRRGKIIKQGSKNLRFVLLQAVPHVKRKCKRLNRLYERVARKHGKNTARIAVARRLLAIILMMLKTRKEFDADH